MCLIFVGVNAHPSIPLFVIANRDEFYSRPTAQASFWGDQSDLFAGRDLLEGGTWAGVNRSGCFAAVTNIRAATVAKTGKRSRGEIVSSFLTNTGKKEPREFLESLDLSSQDFGGFNTLIGSSKRELFHYSSVSKRITQIQNGIHALSNANLNTPWPKVEKGIAALSTMIDSDSLSIENCFALLEDDTRFRDITLPSTGVSIEKERLLSPLFVRSTDYGTRSSLVIFFHQDGRIEIAEKTHAVGQQVESFVRELI